MPLVRIVLDVPTCIARLYHRYLPLFGLLHLLQLDKSTAVSITASEGPKHSSRIGRAFGT